MAITTVRDTARRWLRARAQGTLTIADVLVFLQTARADVELRRWPLLFDARACGSAMTEADVTAAVEMVRSVKDQGRAHVAIVADQDDLYRCFLLYETRCHEIGVREVRVFRIFQDAERWLEILSATREYV